MAQPRNNQVQAEMSARARRAVHRATHDAVSLLEVQEQTLGLIYNTAIFISTTGLQSNDD